MQRTIKSFVLRAGRVSPRQQLALDEWLPEYLLPAPELPWHLSEVFGNEGDVVVEIGFGMGDSLAAMAKARPDLNYIGIEVHRAGIGSLVATLHDEGIHNVRVAPYDAVAVFQTALKDSSLAGVQLFFPDPWPKKKHHKRRLVQSPFIHQLATKIKESGFLHCATDWEAYAHQMMEVLSAEPLLRNTQPEQVFTPRPAHRPLTKFEKRGNQLGHGVWDLVFIKHLANDT